MNYWNSMHNINGIYVVFIHATWLIYSNKRSLHIAVYITPLWKLRRSRKVMRTDVYLSGFRVNSTREYTRHDFMHRITRADVPRPYDNWIPLLPVGKCTTGWGNARFPGKKQWHGDTVTAIEFNHLGLEMQICGGGLTYHWFR